MQNTTVMTTDACRRYLNTQLRITINGNGIMYQLILCRSELHRCVDGSQFRSGSDETDGRIKSTVMKIFLSPFYFVSHNCAVSFCPVKMKMCQTLKYLEAANQVSVF